MFFHISCSSIAK